ncbi:alpha-1 4-glucan-protein synthase [Haloplanus salinus]|uniref:Alpha-1 4-glucan-protein synthase n=1 Tax=Haloplanus salinus TaxID=1126245 RepID=A0A368NAW1_9EURY|nr:alpha-1 4-glucan-protein synthase [Haloplanus salinus]RCU47702.1 alpha-1 4-glucan-protein synthase [Haloplanus salinus]
MSQDVCVIVPTIREYECVRSYVANAENHGFDTGRLEFVLVTEDHCPTEEMEAMLDDLGVAGEVFDGSRREAWLDDHGVGDYTHLIPARSHAQTSFGLLYLWAHDHPYGVFIDDDTRPHDGVDFFGTHLDNLTAERTVESVQSDENWVNVLYHTADEHGLYPRGYPYAAMDETVETGEREVDDVVASQGLWTNVPDLDAVRILMDGDLQGQAETRLTADDFGPDFVAEPGHYLTVCSMNLGFKREVVPAFYQLPMDDNEWSVGRFDDIWSGVFLKRAADVLGTDVLTGDPLCRHDKAPRSTFDDLHNEVAGLELNEHLWTLIDDAGADADTYAGVFEAMADALIDAEADYRNGDFLAFVGEHMHDWLACLDELQSAERAVPADD